MFGGSGSPLSITTVTGVYADEFKNYNQSSEVFAQNNLVASDATILSLWSSAYEIIYASNAVIEGVRASTGLDDNLKKQLEGEARFMRAFCHFYLVNTFGDVPYIDTTSYKINSVIARIAAAQVYERMVSDLKIAQTLLGDTYISAERGRPNKWSATALLARVYLYSEKWVEAQETSSEIINNSNLFSLVQNTDDVFLKASPEAIWQVVSTSPEMNTIDGYYFVLNSSPSIVSISDYLLNDFEAGDTRFDSWIGIYTTASAQYYYPFKYKIKSGSVISEHSILLRLAEQYLIRAEARAHLNNITGNNSAASDIDSIRLRAGLPPIVVTGMEDILLAIEQERRIELFSEWGHRWFDLKRTGRAETVLSPIKPGWDNNDIFFPIPETEISNNPNLEQNNGY